MKRILIALLIIATLVAGASAVYVKLDAPETVNAGDPVVVTITNNIVGGSSYEVVLYKVGQTKRELTRNVVTFQSGQTITTTFQTKGFEKSTYQVEILDPTKEIGGSSTTWRLFTVVNRSSEITFTAPLMQEDDGTLTVMGRIADLGDRGVQIVVESSGENVFGPTFIQTDSSGGFSKEVEIPGPGTYGVNFTDYKGYVGTIQVQVFAITTTPPTATPTPTATGTPLTASAPATRQAPAYFAVDSKSGPVTISTSADLDWVIEIVDESQAKQLINERGTTGGEEVTIVATGGTVYVKVYPMKYTDQGTVTVYVLNADSITAATNGASIFGDVAATTTPAASPLPIIVPLAAVAFLLIRRR
jgi:hypothetical protein